MIHVLMLRLGLSSRGDRIKLVYATHTSLRISDCMVLIRIKAFKRDQPPFHLSTNNDSMAIFFSENIPFLTFNRKRIV